MYLFFGLVYSRSVFETCLNICYWCMNNTAIYNLFLGKKTGRCHQERQSACLPGDCVRFDSLQGQNKSKKSPSFTIFQGEEVFLMCYWAKQSLPRRAWASPKPGSWGSSCLSLWVLKPSLIINMNLCFLVKMCCPTTLYRYFCNLLESCSSCPWSPNVWSTQCRWGAGALEQVCLCFKCIIFFLTRQSSYFLFLLDFSLGLTKSKDKSAFSTVLHERTGWVDRVWDWQGCVN